MSNNTDQETQTRGIMGDVQSVKRNGAASLGELREFIGSLKGRKPQEVMGEVATNGLVQGIVMSSVGFVAVLLVFTAIPFFMAEEQPVVQKEVTPAVAADTQQEGESANDGNSEQTATSDATAEEGATGDAVLDNLGIGETKAADPEENPLGDKFNDLLEGVK